MPLHARGCRAMQAAGAAGGPLSVHRSRQHTGAHCQLHLQDAKHLTSRRSSLTVLCVVRSSTSCEYEANGRSRRPGTRSAPVTLSTATACGRTSLGRWSA